MIKEVTYEHVRQNSGYRKGWSLTIGRKKSGELLFEDLNPKLESPGEYLEEIQRSNQLPRGVHQVVSLDDKRFFRIICDDDAQEVAREFAANLFK